MNEQASTNHDHPYSDWMNKIHEASGYKDEKPHELHQKSKKAEEAREKTDKKVWFAALILFVLALLPRLFFVFVVSDPDNPGAGWFGDAYHHWQIAYLTQEIGMTQGFLRLWDLKGMEYFWGLLHPLFTMIAFQITGLNTVGVERALTSIFGSVSVSLIVLIANRQWNFKTAIAAGLFAALNPIGVFNDGTGMIEPIGIPFLLLGIYFWPNKAFLAGLSFAVALMSRSEYWVFSIFLIIAMLFFTKKVHTDKKAQLIGGFLLLTFIYVKYLLTYTGNPIYPFYENYMANIYGTWQLKPVLTSEDIQAKYLFLIIFISSVISALLVLWKRPKGMYLYLLGLGNWIFLGATFGLGQYIKSYASYVWYVRFMILPYAFLGIVLSVLLFYFIPKVKGLRVLDRLQFTWLIFFAILIIFQFVWIPIWSKYSSTIPTWHAAEKTASDIASHYKGGGLLIFEGNPEITYALVVNHDVKGKDIVGQMFDPYFYFKEDPYSDWEDKREIVLNWLKKNNIKTIATYIQSERYIKLVEYEPQFFTEGVSVQNTNIIIFQVKDEFYKSDI